MGRFDDRFETSFGPEDVVDGKLSPEQHAEWSFKLRMWDEDNARKNRQIVLAVTIVFWLMLILAGGFAGFVLGKAI